MDGGSRVADRGRAGERARTLIGSAMGVAIFGAMLGPVIGGDRVA